MKGLRPLVSLVVLAALVFPADAFAHATLLTEKPGFAARLETSPPKVVLRFDQGVKIFAGALEVYDANGKLLSGKPHLAASDPRIVEAPVRPLGRGGYTVRWRALSSDGHVVSGVYTFGVRRAAPPVTAAYGASGPTRTEDVVRWLYFGALALLIGSLAFRLGVLPRAVPEAVEKRFYRLAGIGVVGVVQVGAVGFLLRSEDALQLPFGKFVYGDLTPMANGTRFGIAFVVMTLGYAWVGGLLFLAWLTDRRWPLWPALIGSVLLASGLSLSGHSAVDAGHSWLSDLADWAHLSAAAVWVGGLVMLAACVFPLAPELRRASFLRFSKLATGLILVILAAGIYLAFLRLPHLSDLWRIGYGQVLLVKIGFACLALTWGAFHHFVARPALERSAEGGIVRRLPRSLVGETSVGIAILLLAAILVNSKPPAAPAPQPTQAATTSP
jgi:copper transport protein